MVSQTVINVLGIIGGVVLAICQAPQLIKLWRTKSAADLSYWYLILYSIGLLFITVYLYLENATVGWICECIETACGVALIGAKFYYDNYGPLSHRAKRRDGSDDGGMQDARSGGGMAGRALTAMGSQTVLLQQHSMGSGQKQPPEGDANSDSSEHSVVGVGAGGSTHAAALPAAASGHQLSKRRRSHESLPI